MTRIFMSGDPVLGMVFDVAEDINAVRTAMTAATSAFVRLTCVREGEPGHLIYLRVDDVAAIEERAPMPKTTRPREIETELERGVPN